MTYKVWVALGSKRLQGISLPFQEKQAHTSEYSLAFNVQAKNWAHICINLLIKAICIHLKLVMK